MSQKRIRYNGTDDDVNTIATVSTEGTRYVEIGVGLEVDSPPRRTLLFTKTEALEFADAINSLVAQQDPATPSPRELREWKLGQDKLKLEAENANLARKLKAANVRHGQSSETIHQLRLEVQNARLKGLSNILASFTA